MFSENAGRITKPDGTLLCEAKIRTSDNQFVLNVHPPKVQSGNQIFANAAKIEEADISLWHERLGHPSYDTVKKTQSAVIGIRSTKDLRSPKTLAEDAKWEKVTENPFQQPRVAPRSHLLSCISISLDP